MLLALPFQKGAYAFVTPLSKATHIERMLESELQAKVPVNECDFLGILRDAFSNKSIGRIALREFSTIYRHIISHQYATFP